MKKFFENFYLFSKIGLNFVLFTCLFGVLYVLYINYQKEDLVTQQQNNLEQMLIDNISENSKLINNITLQIKKNETSLNEIKKNIQDFSTQDNSEEILSLNKNVEMLKNSFASLSNDILNLKNNNYEINLKKHKNQNNDIIEKNRNDIVDLILVKYENNINFETEIEYLKKISKNTSTNIIEKISILSIEPFKGYQYIKNIYDKEVDTYLKKIINNDPESFISKIILPYLEVSPSSENNITSDLILKIKLTSLNIENRNYEEALKNIKSIDNYDNFFKSSFFEIDKYLKFKKNLNELR
ncbi:hypothetical protein N9U75_00780 [Pelagibacteraceae bacterium]|nr:hypothetical protein [Pelagibacteraceae bacterium]